MKVLDLFTRLSRGEFSNLAIGMEGAGIAEEKQAKIIDYANEALIMIFSRYRLLEKNLLIEEVGHITNYHLRKQYAVSSQSNEPYHYIKDLAGDPFKDDVIKILEVTDSRGRLRYLNDISVWDSLFTPQPDTLQDPHPETGRALGVSYQARHPVLRSTGDNILSQDIDIPFYLEKALQSQVASLNFSHMNGQEHVLKSQEYAATYEKICLEIDERDLLNQTSSTSHHKLEQRGFV